MLFVATPPKTNAPCARPLPKFGAVTTDGPRLNAPNAATIGAFTFCRHVDGHRVFPGFRQTRDGIGNGTGPCIVCIRCRFLWLCRRVVVSSNVQQRCANGYDARQLRTGQRTNNGFRMTLTFLQALVLAAYVCHVFRPESVPSWHLYLLSVLAVIEALFVVSAAVNAKSNK